MDKCIFEKVKEIVSEPIGKEINLDFGEENFYNVSRLICFCEARANDFKNIKTTICEDGIVTLKVIDN